MWNNLYRIAAVAIAISLLLIPLSIVGFVIWPPFPEDILTLLQENPFAGLMSLDFLYLLSNIPTIPIFLALYVSLKDDAPSWALLALVMGVMGLVLLVPARPIVEMFALSKLAANGADPAAIDVAQDVLLAQFEGTAYHAHYIIGGLSLLISSLLMLHSPFYSKATAYTGIATNILIFGIYVPQIGIYLSLLSVLGYLVWWVMLGRAYYRAGWSVSDNHNYDDLSK
jgi:hypothetical protein